MIPRSFLGPELMPTAVAAARERPVEMLDRSPRITLRWSSGRQRLTEHSSSLAAVLTKGG